MPGVADAVADAEVSSFVVTQDWLTPKFGMVNWLSPKSMKYAHMVLNLPRILTHCVILGRADIISIIF